MDLVVSPSGNVQQYTSIEAYFKTVRAQKLLLEECFALVTSATPQNVKSRRNTDPIEPKKIFDIVSQDLTQHLRTKSHSSTFYALMSDSAYLTLRALQENRTLLSSMQAWDFSYELQDSILETVIREFHKAASRVIGIHLDIPELVFYMPKYEKDRKLELGLYDHGKIKINNSPEVFNGQCTRAMGTAVHESIHSIQSQLYKIFNQLSIHNPVRRDLEFDPLFWQFNTRDDTYIKYSLSFEAYTAQPIEDIAELVSDRFEQGLKNHLANGRTIYCEEVPAAIRQQSAPRLPVLLLR